MTEEELFRAYGLDVTPRESASIPSSADDTRRRLVSDLRRDGSRSLRGSTRAAFRLVRPGSRRPTYL